MANNAIDSSIFKKYDIRGKTSGADAPINPLIAQRIGQAFGTYIQQQEDKRLVIVGRDNRESSPELALAAMKGINISGCEVIDIGMVSTPMVYWHAMQHGEAGALMVTGSHLAPTYNGFKLALGSRNLYGPQIQEIRGLAMSSRIYYGEGSSSIDENAYSSYLTDLEKRLQPMQRSLKVVIDPGNGTAGMFAPRLFLKLGHDVVCIFCEPDGTYPNHQPDPQVPANMAALGEKVREVGADIGIAFDGDADRMGAVDENGQMIAADRLLALLARDMLKRQPGAAVVADVLSSQVLFDEVAKAGGQPVMWASGHSLVKSKMREIGALLGGEMSGHIFLGEDYYGFDDAFMAAGRLLQLLAVSDQTLSQLNASIPTLY
ncbi:MAG: phosphomannomutase/phosphoglucomutase, partial [Anaerolineae bacterium]|nr:phosphomannomutase/phosphoglucomutase [Anaerolineae bacterium]